MMSHHDHDHERPFFLFFTNLYVDVLLFITTITITQKLILCCHAVKGHRCSLFFHRPTLNQTTFFIFVSLFILAQNCNCICIPAPFANNSLSVSPTTQQTNNGSVCPPRPHYRRHVVARAQHTLGEIRSRSSRRSRCSHTRRRTLAIIRHRLRRRRNNVYTLNIIINLDLYLKHTQNKAIQRSNMDTASYPSDEELRTFLPLCGTQHPVWSLSLHRRYNSSRSLTRLSIRRHSPVDPSRSAVPVTNIRTKSSACGVVFL